MKVLKRPMFKYGGGVKKQGIMHGMKGMQDGGPATMADATGLANGGMPNMRGRVTRPGGYAGKEIMENRIPMKTPNFYRENILGPRFTDDNYKPKMNLQSGTGFNFMKPNVQTGEGYQNIMKKKLENENKQKLINMGRTDIELDQIGSLTPIEEARAAKAKTEAAIAKDITNEPEKSIFSTEELQSPSLKERVDKQFNTQKDTTLKKTGILSPKETDEKRLKKIYDIMGVDDAKKDAAYNALIDLSQGQAIDTKDISGSINRAIGALSKRADKVTDLKDKGKAALASGTIQEMFRDKESAADKKLSAYAKASGKTKEFVANKELGLANSLQDAVSLLRKEKKGQPITAADIVTTAMAYGEEKGIPFKQTITTEQKREKVGKGKDYATVVDLVQALELNPDGSDDGIYVVGTSIIQVEKGVAKLKG